MAPEALVQATRSWLQSSWHVQVPFAWLQACVDWLQQEAGGAASLSQQQINQQALDQWLLTDLRDLDHAVLPEGLARAQKTELRGTFCVQVDSLLDISQPAYGQLQKWKGTDCANDDVSATTQATQRPWEAKATRMLLLQVTDGVQSLEAMEYQPIPALSTDLRPGVKLQLQGQMVCRLGVLLLGPSNVKVLGGEVEDLADRNTQGRVLCRTLGLPEDEQQGGEEAAPSPRANQEVEDLEIDDQELLASLDAQEQLERVPAWPVRDSGYGTLSETSTNSSVRSLTSSTPARSQVSTQPARGGLTPSSRGRHHGNPQQESGLLDPFSPERMIERQIADDHMVDEDFPEEDFDDLPLDELDGGILQESDHMPGNRNAAPFRPGFPPVPSEEPQQSSRSVAYDESDFMVEDMDCLFEEVELCGALQTGQTGREKDDRTGTCSSSVTPTERASGSAPSALTLTSPPFTYLSLLEETIAKTPPPPPTLEVRVKAFIVTLTGKLSSANGSWRVAATISDGSGYLDVELSDAVLTGLLGFSVAEKAVLKREPARRGELDAGMRRCQEQLVDMCCVMTVAVDAESRRSVVTQAQPVSEAVRQQLEERRSQTRK